MVFVQLSRVARAMSSDDIGDLLAELVTTPAGAADIESTTTSSLQVIADSSAKSARDDATRSVPRTSTRRVRLIAARNVGRFGLKEGRPFPLGATWDGLGVNFAL